MALHRTPWPPKESDAASRKQGVVLVSLVVDHPLHRHSRGFLSTLVLFSSIKPYEISADTFKNPPPLSIEFSWAAAADHPRFDHIFFELGDSVILLCCV